MEPVAASPVSPEGQTAIPPDSAPIAVTTTESFAVPAGAENVASSTSASSVPSSSDIESAGVDTTSESSCSSDSDSDTARRKKKALKKKKAEGKQSEGSESKSKKKKKRSDKPEYFRADEVWDRKSNSFKLKKTAVRSDKDEYGQYVFHVRRCFDSRGELQRTVVDVKSLTLKKLLEAVMGSCKDVSFAESQPEIDPNMIFLYLEELRELYNKIKARSESNEEDEKRRKAAAEQAGVLHCLLEYMDKDYERLKARLRGLLETGDITFELLWALFRSDDIAYFPTYSTPEEPRAMRVNFTYKANSMMKGVCFCIEGDFFNYDGKNFGLSTGIRQIDHFEGTRRITSLPCYPFKYHPTSTETQKALIERGKKFVNLIGTNYRSHEGLGFMKRDDKVIKVSVSSRVMIDPLVFRRIDPNYPVQPVKPDGSGDLRDAITTYNVEKAEEDMADVDDLKRYRLEAEQNHRSRPALKLVMDKEQSPHLLDIQLDEEGKQVTDDVLKQLLADGGSVKRDFTEEELLIASPVVLGFAFTQKLWLEFTVSGVQPIEWNDGAFESLVLPEKQKSLVKALVTSHASVNADRDTIDDVIKGKGKGLVAVLHGTPGVGKTLTAEGIADLLRRPLYYVSAGELGTNPRELETELTKILDVAQTWGAVLLLDEAEIFLEARTAQDIHRNALVSIFLRVLEYFQGILFLTTNRVTAFDAAFQSRIHFALRYQELDFAARRAIFAMFIERVAASDPHAAAAPQPAETDAATATTAVATKATGSAKVAAFSAADLDRLARRGNLNGRQIKNAVRSAQALALAEAKPMAVAHILRVLEIAETFEQDLKGGTGYMDAMRSYT